VTEVALLYSHASRRIDRSKLYGAGRYYVGVGGEFIRYPITQQELILPPFDSRTSDGLKISLEVSINYKVNKDFEKILQIFDDFGYHYDGYLSRLAMNIIRDASANFTAFSYAQNRSQVSQQMELDISDDMNEIGFTLDSVQLLNVEFPSNFSNTLQGTLLLQQQVTQAYMNKDAEDVALNGQLVKSNVTANGVITDAKSQANTIKENADAAAESLKVSLEKEALSHLNMIYFFGNLSLAEGKTQEVAEVEGRQKFVAWYWMNQVAASTAPKNLALSVPDGFSP